MDPTELGRWTRFAVKGGIGKCTAVQDCIAQSPDDLMFMQGDEIVVLMHLQDQQDVYLGYCEGVVGRFEGSYVKFHSKLKRPVAARRSSVASSPAPSSRPSSKSPAPSLRTVSSSFSNNETAERHSIFASVESEKHATAPRSLDVSVSADDASESHFANYPSSSAPDSIFATTLDLDPTPEAEQYSSNQTFQLSDESASYPVKSHDIPESSSTSEPSTRISVATYDGMEGIGLSLLQDFMAGNGDDSSSEASGDRTPEPRLTDSPESTVEFHEHAHEPVPTKHPVFSITTQEATDPLETASLTSSNPSDYSEYVDEEWEGASDIYDNYRYSRFSVASKMSRYSKSSMPTPPPIPIDHPRPSVDSTASVAGRPMPLDLDEQSPLLRTRFESPPMSPTVILTALNSTAILSSDRDTLVPGELPVSQQSLIQPVELQTHLTLGRRAQLVAQTDETPSSLCIDDHSYADPASLTSDDGKQSEPSPSTLVVINHAPRSSLPSDDPSLECPQPVSFQYTSSTPSPSQQAPESSSAARPRPRTQLSSPGLDFGSSRTSMFLPHPGAPKAPATTPSGPLYGRAKHSPVPPPSSAFASPGGQSSSLFKLLRVAGMVQYYPNGRPRQATIYGQCEIDLTNSAGPVPISWSLEPPMSIPANRIPVRSQTNPHMTQLWSPLPHDSLRPSASLGGELGNIARLDGSFPPSAHSMLDPSPQQPELRRRSRSFSGLDTSLQLSGEMESNSTQASLPSSTPRARSSSSDDSGLRFSDVKTPPAIIRAHQPSPLSLPQNATKHSSPVSPKPHISSISFPKSSSSSSHMVQTSAESLPTPVFGLNGHPQSPLRQATSNLSLHTTRVSVTSPTLIASNSSPVTLQSSTRLLSISGETMPSTLARGESPSTPLSPTSPQAFDMVDSPLNSPRPSISSSHGHSMNFPRHSSVTVTAESTSVVKVARARDSMDTDVSRSSETRNPSLVSPSLTLSSTSALPPAISSGASKHLSLRSKISLSALRAKSGIPRVESQDGGTSPSTPVHGELRDFETVQVKDMDFELIKPNLQRAPSPQLSLDSSGGKRWDFSSQSSPVRPDGVSFLQVESPTTSMPSPAISDHDSLLPLINPPTIPPPNPNPVPNNTPDSMSREEMEAHRHRELKWVSLMSSVPPAHAKKSKKVKKLLLDGVPASVRYQVWAHLADCKAKRMNGLYSQLMKRGKVPASSTIEQDVAEFFRDQPQSKDGSVVSVLQAYLNLVPDVQYNRGLACIVGQLLAQAPEEDAFWIFVSIMDSYLRPYFALNHVQIEIDASLFAKAVEANDSAVANKVFVDMGILPAQICRLWFSTLFFDALPSEYHLRVWDVFLFEGIPFLLRIGLALFSCCRRAFLESQGQKHVVSVLSRVPLACLPSNPDALIQLAMSVKLKDDDIRKHRSKMEAQLKRQTQSRAKSTVNGGGAAISLPRR